MSRAKKIKKKLLPPDPIYGSRLVTRFINRLMKSGKKTVAQKIMYRALLEMKSKTQNDPLKILTTAIQNVGPKIEVRPRRVGGASYQVPTEVRGDRREGLAIRWLIDASSKRKHADFVKKGIYVMARKLAQELLDASRGLGEAIKKRDQTHRMAEANKAFAHFRW